MFSASADLYDLVYSGFKDYPAEAAGLAATIKHAHPTAHTVLDVACGTAEHARILTAHHGFAVDGLDVDPAFVRIARGKLPNGSVYQGDMTSFELSRRYDVILCLFSSIGYVRTLENVRRTLVCFRSHLASGGIIAVEPWFSPDALQPGRIFVKTAEAPGVTVCRMSPERAIWTRALRRASPRFMMCDAGDRPRVQQDPRICSGLLSVLAPGATDMMQFPLDPTLETGTYRLSPGDTPRTNLPTRTVHSRLFRVGQSD
jgi:SAM-dependent methyltransferase